MSTKCNSHRSGTSISETCPSSFKGTRCNNPGVLGRIISLHTSPSATERYRTLIVEDVEIVRANVAAHATTGGPNHWTVKMTADVAAAIPTQSGIISSHRLIVCRSSGTPARPMMRSAPQISVRAVVARERTAFQSIRAPYRRLGSMSTNDHNPPGGTTGRLPHSSAPRPQPLPHKTRDTVRTGAWSGSADRRKPRQRRSVVPPRRGSVRTGRRVRSAPPPLLAQPAARAGRHQAR